MHRPILITVLTLKSVVNRQRSFAIILKNTDCKTVVKAKILLPICEYIVKFDRQNFFRQIFPLIFISELCQAGDQMKFDCEPTFDHNLLVYTACT